MGRVRAQELRTAVIYCRVSTEEQTVHGVSLADQEVRGRAYCSLHDLTVVAVLVDEGVSAGKPLRDRPRGSELVRLVESGRVGAVVGSKLDRLFRDTVDCLSTVKQWQRRGVALHLLDIGGQSIDTGSATGGFFLTLLAALAQMERSLIGERTRAALRHKQIRGDRLGATPLGFYTPEPGAPMIPVADELDTVRIIVSKRKRRRPMSFRKIAALLERQNRPTKRGGRWSAAAVKRVWDRRERYDAGLLDKP